VEDREEEPSGPDEHAMLQDRIFQQRLRIEQLRNERDHGLLRRAVVELQAMIRVQNATAGRRNKPRTK
jgi:hypothetical protein